MPRQKYTTTDFDQLSATQAAAVMGCAGRTFYRAMLAGLIPRGVQTLGGKRWTRCDLTEAQLQLANHPTKWKRRLAATRKPKRTAAKSQGLTMPSAANAASGPEAARPADEW